MWYQRTITLSEKLRGFHLITDEITDKLSGLPPVETGLLHLLLLHTSASLTLNENCDPTVRADMERHFLKTVPDNAAYEHDYEGADDMPSHIKSSVLGVVAAACTPGAFTVRNMARYLVGRAPYSRWST